MVSKSKFLSPTTTDAHGSGDSAGRNQRGCSTHSFGPWVAIAILVITCAGSQLAWMLVDERPPYGDEVKYHRLAVTYARLLNDASLSTPAEVLDQWTLDADFDPVADRSTADALHGQWLRAVEHAKGWES